jgi:hypothetical protein
MFGQTWTPAGMGALKPFGTSSGVSAVGVGVEHAAVASAKTQVVARKDAFIKNGPLANYAGNSQAWARFCPRKNDLNMASEVV